MAEPSPQKEPEAATKPPSQPAPKADAAPAGEKKLSGAELKKKAKEEKAARRAQEKSARGGAPSGPPQQQQQQAGGDKGAKGKPQKQGGQQQQQQQSLPVRSVEQRPKENKSLLPEALGHLSLAKRPGITETDKDVQPPILRLGLHMAGFQVRDSTERLVFTLMALKTVIDAYTTPQGTTFSRHFTSHVLNPQIEHLQACRPMSFGMGNAIRWLKLQISKVDIDMSDFEVKRALCEDIDNFIHSRVQVARPEIAKQAAEQLKNGDTVVTFGDHYLVRETLIHAHNEGRKLKVVVCEDAWQPHAHIFVERLKKAGFSPRQIEISYEYGQHCLKLEEKVKAGDRVTVLVGAEAMFNDGALYARQGILELAHKASKLGRHIVALCETINVTDRVAADSLTLNEHDPNLASHDTVRLLFDVVSPAHIARVVTEFGTCPPEAMDVILVNQGEF